MGSYYPFTDFSRPRTPIRRRSGGPDVFRSKGGTVLHSPRVQEGLTIPSVVLVPSSTVASSPSGSLPSPPLLPPLPTWVTETLSKTASHSHEHPTYSPASHVSDPHPNHHALEFRLSSDSEHSNVPRLPTPDFLRDNGEDDPMVSLRDVVENYRSCSHSQSHHSPDRNESAHLSREVTRASTSSINSSSSVVSTRSILPEKFTDKWPKPRSMAIPTASKTRMNPGLGSSTLQESEGLGFESVNRWTVHKWCLIVSVSTVFVTGMFGLVCALQTWFETWQYADVMNVADPDILVLVTLAASILLFTSLLGFSGTLLNSRPILALYALLLWPAFVSMLSIGYVSYKRSAYSLDRKLNLAWSEWYSPLGRFIIQNSLECCGYYDGLHDAMPSSKCYTRTPLPGCKGKLIEFEQGNLEMIWTIVFSLVPLHIINIIVALLCANHVTRTFGKGLMPKQYRLRSEDVVRTEAEKARLLEQVARPEISRASSSGVFREDRDERAPLLMDEEDDFDVVDLDYHPRGFRRQGY